MNGCIVVHGLTGTPACVEPLREALSDAGFSVAAPCLAGHGSTLEDLSNSTWEEWYQTIHVAYNELKRSCDNVFFAGISLGALLGLKLAQDEKWGIKAFALMSTPVKLPFLTNLAIYTTKYTKLDLFIRSVKKDFNKSVSDIEGQKLYKQSSLGRISSKAVFQLKELQKDVLLNLSKVDNPLFLIHSKKDRVVPVKNVDLIKNEASSEVIKTLILDKSEHVITLDLEKNFVSQEIISFFNLFI